MLAAAQNRSGTAPVDSVSAPQIQAPAANYRFPNGVTYVYVAEWRLWNGGTATLHLDAEGGTQHVTAGVDSTGVVALLYKVHDRFDARFDPRTFCSQSLTKHTEEGLRRRQTEIRFDYARHKTVLDETNLKNNEKKHLEQDIPGCVTDVISGIYYMGSLPLLVGGAYSFPISDGGKTATLTANVEAREQIKTDAGTFSTLRVRPETNLAILKDRGKAWIWYTDDAQRIPVQMRARLFWGTLTLKLQRVEKH